MTTMQERHGGPDDSHECCDDCGFCKTCGDCGCAKQCPACGEFGYTRSYNDDGQLMHWCPACKAELFDAGDVKANAIRARAQEQQT